MKVSTSGIVALTLVIVAIFTSSLAQAATTTNVEQAPKAGTRMCYVVATGSKGSDSSNNLVYMVDEKVSKAAFRFGYGNATTTAMEGSNNYLSTIYYYVHTTGFMYAVFRSSNAKAQQNSNTYTMHYFNLNTLQGVTVQVSDASFSPVQAPSAATFNLVDCKEKQAINIVQATKQQVKGSNAQASSGKVPDQFCYRVNGMGSSDVHMAINTVIPASDFGAKADAGFYTVKSNASANAVPHFVIAHPEATGYYTLFTPAQDYGGVHVWTPATPGFNTGSFSWFDSFTQPFPRYYEIRTNELMWNCDKQQ